MQIDHMILRVEDLDASLGFYTGILGLDNEGFDDPFTMIRVSPSFTLLLAPWGSDGGEHLAFFMEDDEFDAVFGRVQAAGLPYGDSFQTVGNMEGPGWERGARVYYFNDPNGPLIEIRH